MEGKNELRVSCWLVVGRYMIPQVRREFLQKNELYSEERYLCCASVLAMANSLEIGWT